MYYVCIMCVLCVYYVCIMCVLHVYLYVSSMYRRAFSEPLASSADLLSHQPMPLSTNNQIIKVEEKTSFYIQTTQSYHHRIHIRLGRGSGREEGEGREVGRTIDS